MISFTISSKKKKKQKLSLYYFKMSDYVAIK